MNRNEISLASTEIQPTYGNKLRNRLETAFAASQLPLVGGNFDGQVAKAKHFMPHLPPFPLTADTRPEQVAAFNVKLPNVAQRMLFINDSYTQKESYIDSIGGVDFKDVPALAVSLAKDAVTYAPMPSERPVVRLVYGATENMPYRALSYLLPPLVYLDNLKKAGVSLPQLQVIFAHHISGGLNHLNPERVQDEVRKFSEIGREYAQEFFPDVAQSVVFLEDTSLDKGTSLRDGLLSVAAVARDKLPEEIKNTLLEKGDNGGKPINVFYGAAHTLLHDMDLPGSLSPLFADQRVTAAPTTIISIGGYQERQFYEVRHAIKPYLSSEFQAARTIQFFTKHRVPPYLASRKGDVGLDDVLQNPSKRFQREGLGAAVVHDIDYFERVSERRGDVAEFLERQVA